jgi:hypothetical protein
LNVSPSTTKDDKIVRVPVAEGEEATEATPVPTV